MTAVTLKSFRQIHRLIYVPVYQSDQVYYDAPYGAPFITFGFGCALVDGWITILIGEAAI